MKVSNVWLAGEPLNHFARDWRETMIAEAAWRAAQPRMVAILKRAVHSENRAAMLTDINEELQQLVIETNMAASLVAEGLRVVPGVPESDDDLEATFRRVLRAGLSGDLNGSEGQFERLTDQAGIAADHRFLDSFCSEMAAN